MEGDIMTCCVVPDPEELQPNFSTYPKNPESGYKYARCQNCEALLKRSRQNEPWQVADDNQES